MSRIDRPRKGHLYGGLFLIAPAGTAIAAACTLAACGPARTSATNVESGPGVERLSSVGQAYRELGFIVGEGRFAAVGRFVHLPGPGDSTLTVLALSLPNAALRFRREETGFLARYRVVVTVGDTTAPIARLNETHEVHVRTFRETSRRGESIVFQGLLTLPAGEFRTRVRARDLASSAGLAVEVNLRVPRFGPETLTAPILVHRAEPRARRDQRPSFILRPTATLPFGSGQVLVYLEADSPGPEPAILEVIEEGQVIWSDTVKLPSGSGSLHAVVAEIDGSVLPPGGLELRARLPGHDAESAETLLITLEPTQVLKDYEQWMSYLRYAGTAAELEELRDAPVGERAQRLSAFWKRRDPDPATGENEFFEGYFRRIREANNRFSEATTEGWLTDRGAVYVTLGPPDEVFRHLDAPEGPDTHQIWLYNRSLDFELRLVFVDVAGSGAFDLTVESRRRFSEAIERLYS